jgi:hypothetical protein
MESRLEQKSHTVVATSLFFIIPAACVLIKSKLIIIFKQLMGYLSGSELCNKITNIDEMKNEYNPYFALLMYKY